MPSAGALNLFLM